MSNPTPVLTPKRKKGMGHIAKPYPTTAPTIRPLLGAPHPLAITPVDYSAYVDKIRDQGQTQKCVGEARARTTHILAQRQRFGKPDPGAVLYPSATGIYTLAREESTPEGDPLTDVGSSPVDADTALSKDVGIPLERDWSDDDDATLINERLPVNVLARAMAIKLVQYHVIDSSGVQRVTDACQTLTQYGPLSIAIPVGPEYEECGSDAPVMATTLETPYGWHDIPLVAWRFDPKGTKRRQFLSPGSWGTSFGFGGYAWLDESVLSDPRAIDFSVPVVVTNWVGVQRYIAALARQNAEKETAS